MSLADERDELPNQALEHLRRGIEYAVDGLPVADDKRADLHKCVDAIMAELETFRARPMCRYEPLRGPSCNRPADAWCWNCEGPFCSELHLSDPTKVGKCLGCLDIERERSRSDRL